MMVLRENMARIKHTIHNHFTFIGFERTLGMEEGLLAPHCVHILQCFIYVRAISDTTAFNVHRMAESDERKLATFVATSGHKHKTSNSSGHLV